MPNEEGYHDIYKEARYHATFGDSRKREGMEQHWIHVVNIRISQRLILYTIASTEERQGRNFKTKITKHACT